MLKKHILMFTTKIRKTFENVSKNVKKRTFVRFSGLHIQLTEAVNFRSRLSGCGQDSKNRTDETHLVHPDFLSSNDFAE